MSNQDKMGRIIRVPNTQRVFGEASEYFAVRVEDENGGNERAILLTEHELKAASERAERNKEDLPRVGWLRDLID